MLPRPIVTVGHSESAAMPNSHQAIRQVGGGRAKSGFAFHLARFQQANR